ncbi:MAG: hypothetical protein Fur0027_19700 [Raineya sp.]
MIDLLRQELRRFSRQTVFQIGFVKSVDKPKAVCNVSLLENEEIVLENVRLQAIDNEQDNGVLYFPKTGSSVIVGKMDNIDSYFVAMFSEAEEIIWKLDGAERLKITNDEIVFNGGTKGAMVEINKLKNRLNAIENAFNELLNHYKTHNHAHPNGATTGFLVPSVQVNITITGVSDLENADIKQ